MTTRATWLDLAERCEKAVGRDCGIEKSIHRALGLTPEKISTAGYGWREDEVGWWFLNGDDARVYPMRNDPLKITASLDAITALTERELPGCGWEIDRPPSDARIAGRPVIPRARVQQHGDMWTYEGWPACSGVTSALALCAAFCRAMSERATE